MKLRRSLLAAGVPLTTGLALASPALAGSSAPRVTVRVEGATKTLLAPRSVTPPRTGWVTRAGAPKGSCPAASAAGALNLATHGRWNGTYDKGLGVEISTILGTTASYARGSYWEFFVNNRPASAGICDTRLTRGDTLLFAQVPAKGKAELPIVVRAPTTVTAGRPFTVRAFVATGHGDGTRPLRDWRAQWSFAAIRSTTKLRLTKTRTAPRGEMRFTVSGVSSATARLVVSAKGEIRSAVTTIKVVR